jgi:hypothetical protein
MNGWCSKTLGFVYEERPRSLATETFSDYVAEFMNTVICLKRINDKATLNISKCFIHDGCWPAIEFK